MQGSDYEFDAKRFDSLLSANGYRSRLDFCTRTGFPRRTLGDLLAGYADPKLSTIARLVCSLPGSRLDDFFTITTRVAA